MDNDDILMNIALKGPIGRRLVSRILEKVIKDKLGLPLSLRLETAEITTTNSDYVISIKVNAVVPKSKAMSILQEQAIKLELGEKSICAGEKATTTTSH